MGWSPGGSPSRKIENRNGKMRKAVLSLLLWSWTGTVYFFLEIIWKTAHSRPESISWTMLALAIVLAVPLERFGAELPWECPLWAQGLICGTGITAVEFVSGLVLNVWFKMGVWDYSGLWGNLLGQICPQFWALWCALSVPAIVLLDWMRYAVEGGDKPFYKFKRRCRMEPWIQMVVTIVCSVIASSGFWAFVNKRSDSRDVKTEMLVGLAHDRIVYLGMMYIDRGHITQDEYENLYQYLYKPYEKMGGNGSAKRIMNEVNKLPLRKSEYNEVGEDKG